MTLAKQQLDEIIARIRRVSSPQRIVLFGSAATGTMTRHSDLDLLVITSEEGPIRRIRARIRTALFGLEIPVDLVVMRPEDFEATRELIGGIAYPAARSGKTVYEAA